MRKYFKTAEQSSIIMLIAAAVAITSQFYFNVFTGSFRISFAVIVLPLLIMTLGEDISTIKICCYTALAIFILRTTVYYGINNSYDDILTLYLPNAVFYIAYGAIFHILCPDKHTVGYRKLLYTIFISDFLSNFCEICVSNTHTDFSGVVNIIATLVGIAAVRSMITWVFLIAEKQYRTLLQKEEHEKRYQRLFLMTTGLKNEIYFMKKNSEEIERVMGTAYKLYEKISTQNADDEIKKMSLALATDVHEIKKDYIRIIKGIENEITVDCDQKNMAFSDLLYILKSTTHHLLKSKNLNILLDFSYDEDFVTEYHYELMNIFKNLVTNAIEAMENDEKGDRITLRQSRRGSNFIFVVSDNGPGITKRHLPNIFNMGYSTKFDKATGNIYRGVGLCGVKSIVEETLGGSITVESAFGEGAVFTVSLPAAVIAVE